MSKQRNSAVLVLVEDLWEFSLWVWNNFLFSSVQLGDHHQCTPAWRCSPTSASCATVRWRMCRSSWGSPGIGNILLSIRGLLRISILFDLVPPDHDGVLIVFPCSSSDIHCFPMVSLPLSFAVFLTSWVIYSCKVIRNYHSLKSGFDPVYCASSSRRQMPQEQKVNSSGMCFKQEWHWTVLDICPVSCDSMLPISWIVRLDSTLNFMEFSGFPKSSGIDLVREPFLNFPLLLEFVPFSLHLPRSHLVQFHQLWGRLKIQALLSQQVTQYFASVSWRQEVLGYLLGTLILSLHQFPGAGRRTLRCVLPLLRLPGTLECNLRCGTRRRESFKWRPFSFREITL